MADLDQPAERFVSNVRLCCLGGPCGRPHDDGGPWIPTEDEWRDPEQEAWEQMVGRRLFWGCNVVLGLLAAWQLIW